jgi:hypothetical protein
VSYESEQLLKPPIFVFAQMPAPLVVSTLDETVFQISSEISKDEIIVSQAHVRVETNVFIPYVAIFL